MGDPFKVTIDFKTSHLVFPTLIGAVLVLLGIAILVTNRHAILNSGATWARHMSLMDKPRFFGTIGLSILYFLLMVPVGDLWPNTGLGFLICSIPFVALTGLLYMHERGARSVIPLMIVAVLAPVLVWVLFTYVFALTLP